MFDTSYLNDLTKSLKFVQHNRAALTQAAINGDLMAQCIMDRFYSFVGGNYQRTQIVSFNAECEAWQAEHA